MRTHTPVTSDAIGRGQRRGAGVEEVRAELVALARVLVRHGRTRIIVWSERRGRAPVDAQLLEAGRVPTKHCEACGAVAVGVLTF